MNRSVVIGAVLVLVAAATAWQLRSPGWGLSEAEVIAAERRGRQVFLSSCAPCHRGESDLPGQDELQSDYSTREIAATLDKPPAGMAVFTGTDAERRDLLVFLNGG